MYTPLLLMRSQLSLATRLEMMAIAEWPFRQRDAFFFARDHLRGLEAPLRELLVHHILLLQGILQFLPAMNHSMADLLSGSYRSLVVGLPPMPAQVPETGGATQALHVLRGGSAHQLIEEMDTLGDLAVALRALSSIWAGHFQLLQVASEPRHAQPLMVGELWSAPLSAAGAPSFPPRRGLTRVVRQIGDAISMARHRGLPGLPMSIARAYIPGHLWRAVLLHGGWATTLADGQEFLALPPSPRASPDQAPSEV